MNTDQTAPGQQVEWLTSKQAAERIRERGIHMPDGRLRQIRAAGRGPRYRKRNPDVPQSEVFYASADVDAWLEEQHPANWPVTETTP